MSIWRTRDRTHGEHHKDCSTDSHNNHGHDMCLPNRIDPDCSHSCSRLSLRRIKMRAHISVIRSVYPLETNTISNAGPEPGVCSFVNGDQFLVPSFWQFLVPDTFRLRNCLHSKYLQSRFVFATLLRRGKRQAERAKSPPPKPNRKLLTTCFLIPSLNVGDASSLSPG